MAERIDAPAKVLDAIKRAQETIDRLQAEAQAIVFGAAIGLGVPDNWTWDGRGCQPGRVHRTASHAGNARPGERGYYAADPHAAGASVLDVDGGRLVE